MQQGALGENTAALSLRGAPGGGAAQAQLAQTVAGQQGAQANTAQSAQQFAAQQGASFAGLSNAIAASTQGQGASARAGVGRETASRINKSNREYDTNIQTTLGKLADVKASKGSTMVKNLLELQGNERKFMLGKQAVQGEKEKLAADSAAAAAGAAADANQQGFDNNLALQKLGLENKKYGLDQWEAHHPDAGSNEKKKQQETVGQEVKEVKSLIGPIVSSLGKVPGGVPSKKVLNTYINEVNAKASADPALVAKVVREWWLKKNPAGIVIPW
jgi:hypothetical protein